MKKLILYIILSTIVLSCMSVEEKKKKAEEDGNALVAIKSKMIKGAGDALKSDGKEAIASASEGIGEVVKGANSGFDKSFTGAEISIDSISAELLQVGRTQKSYANTEGVKKVSVYLIAKQNFAGTVKLKAFDDSGLEIGRSTMDIEIEYDDAKFFDFVFDDRTPLLQASAYSLRAKQKEK